MNTSINKQYSETLDLLRFPLAIIIVSVHIMSKDLYLQGSSVSFNNMPILNTLNSCVDIFFRGQSVPIYYFISGYVFFLGGNFSLKIFKNKLKNRFKTLFIPYCLWNIISILLFLSLFLPIFNNIVPNISSVDIDFSLKSILQFFGISTNNILQINFPHNYALWFIRDLMIVVLSTPILYYLIKKTKFYLITFLCIAWFFVGVFQEYGRIEQLLSAFSFFYLGAYFSINKKDLLITFNKLFIPSIILYLIFSIGCIICNIYDLDLFNYFKRANIIVGLFLAYNISSLFIKKNICKVNGFLSQSSYFIYLSHTIICTHILKILLIAIKPNSDIGTVVIYLLAITLTILSLLFTSFILQRYFPNLNRLLTGKK